MPRHRSGDRSVVGGDRAILDRGIGYLRRGDRYTLDRWLGLQGGGPSTGPPPGHDGQPVLLWPNQAPPIVAQRTRAGLINLMNLTAAGGTAPIFKENIINGHPVVRFSSAGGSVMDVTGGIGFFPADIPWTVMTVARAVPGKALYGFNGNAYVYVPALSAGAGLGRFYALDQAYQFWIDPNGDLPQVGDGNFHIFTAAAGPNYAMFVDGTHIAHGFQGIPNADNYFHVGHGDSDGDIAALLHYRVDLADTDQANLRTYLAIKYNIPIANPGTPVAPDTVAGLYGWFEADTIFP